MHEVNPGRVRITGPFWGPRLEVNAGAALQHQWQQLEASGCIDNFRLAAGRMEGFRSGWFFADSDAYKWLDAACRAYATRPAAMAAEKAELLTRIDAFVDLVRAAQEADGYLYTYNQLHFPGTRWINLQIEHELYCHGHLIEAAIAHFEATGRREMLDAGLKAADLLVRDFGQGVAATRGAEATPGHQEIEIALLKLHAATGDERYLDLAQQFIERRGRIKGFALHILSQNRSVEQRSAQVEAQRDRYETAHPEHAKQRRLPETNAAPKPPGIQARWMLSALSGKYFQQYRPVRKQTAPVGHAVRFAYLETAMAMLARAKGDDSLLPALKAAWQHMVERRMYVTGGIGALPAIEGFGRDYELDPAYAYAETCAALGCLFWNWQMTLLSGEAQYADLFEWQLYNAAGVGMGLDGCTYLYNNPLASRGEVTRRAWYEVPCCPSNLSRTWAYLGGYLYSYGEDALWVHQYVSSEAELDLGQPVQVEVDSELPWQGRVRLTLSPAAPTALTLHLRVPSWTDGCRVAVNGEAVETAAPPVAGTVQAASGYTPQDAYYVSLARTWSPGDLVELEFSMPITARRAHPRVKGLDGRVALSRGPLVYCLEDTGEGTGFDVLDAALDLDSLQAVYRPELLGGVWVLAGRTVDGQAVEAIPYYAWANRGPSRMAVWVRR